ncbi:MAG: magnesium/cobalt transporter CorA, partial [Nitriliruptorales bacterium]|nr:magnesium/cobalt transporter CorA [Nitriliruptorales bacterium]
MRTIRHIVDGQVHHVSPDDLDECLARPDGFVWLDIAAATPEEAELLHDERLGLEPLIVDDMLEDRHLPKVEAYGDQVGLTVHGLSIEEMDEVTTVELDVAIKDHLLVTFHVGALTSISTVGDRLDRNGPGMISRPVELAHVVLDTMNDVFVPLLDTFEQRLDIIEDEILARPSEDTRREIYRLQRDVIQLRRAVVPQAEAIRRLGRDRIGIISSDDQKLFRDLYDHLYRINELTGSYLQLADSAMVAYRSSLDDQLNDMLRVLTLISALLLPITVIGSIYGMNFEHMPELAWQWAYPAVWGVFLLIVAVFLVWFRRRGWLGPIKPSLAWQAMRDVMEV